MQQRIMGDILFPPPFSLWGCWGAFNAPGMLRAPGILPRQNRHFYLSGGFSLFLKKNTWFDCFIIPFCSPSNQLPSPVLFRGGGGGGLNLPDWSASQSRNLALYSTRHTGGLIQILNTAAASPPLYWLLWDATIASSS